MKAANATARYKILLHGSTWWHRALLWLWLTWGFRRLKRHHDPTGKIIWSGDVDVCADPSTCKLPDCTLREAHR